MNLSFIEAVDLLVGVLGFFTWALFLPQIKLLIKEKSSKSISLGMTWGSWAIQVLILLQSVLHQNWSLALTMGVSVIFLTITNALIHYYRFFPGGR